MTRFEELVCSSDMAKAVLSVCDLGRGPLTAFFYDWQTLISGGLAILAALATVVCLRRQIAVQQEQVDLQRNQYRQENRQKVKTALIGVPHALVEIHSYVGCFDAWKAEKPDDRPAPPTDALKVIMDAAAFVDDDSFDSFRHLVIASQTFETRIASPGRQRAHNTLSTMIVDWPNSPAWPIGYSGLRGWNPGRRQFLTSNPPEPIWKTLSTGISMSNCFWRKIPSAPGSLARCGNGFMDRISPLPLPSREFK